MRVIVGAYHLGKSSAARVTDILTIPSSKVLRFAPGAHRKVLYFRTKCLYTEVTNPRLRNSVTPGLYEVLNTRKST